MPRSQKSKHRAREKRRETQGQPQGLTGPQATAENQKEPHSSTISSPDYRGARPKSSHASVPQKSQGASLTGSPDAGVSCSKSDVAAKGQGEKSASSCQKAAFIQSTYQDPLNRKYVLVQFLLEKYEKKESILKADLLKLVSRQYKQHFPEFLRRTSELLKVVFGVEWKEMDSSSNCDILVSKVGLSSEGSLSGDKI
ncbi:LOW QUALITY PROTEIN: Melanoma-associated antigen B6 [Plecturocebus cupreus]